MPALLPTLLTASQLVLAVADVPKLDVAPGCRDASAAAVRDGQTNDVNACMRDEQTAREQLEKQWDQYSAADQTRCVQLTGTGGNPSYVEVLTCLQIAKEVKQLPGGGNK